MWNSGRLPSISATVSPRRDAEPGEPAGERVDAVAQLRPREADLVVLRAHRDAVGMVLDREPERLGHRARADASGAAARRWCSPMRRTLPRPRKPSPVSRPMSFVSPITNSPITSAKPTNPARSITLNGIARPRTFSASAQKMWPPSSGRNGNRLMIAERQRDHREQEHRAVGRELDRLARRLVGADDAGDLLALLGVEDAGDRLDRRRRDDPHLVDARRDRVADAVDRRRTSRSTP